jgi:CO dehydrogenase nickel-insertion accessory protein CooC1
LLGELEVDGRTVICDMEAGIGTILRLLPGQVDVVLVVTDATAKSIDVARRAATVASGRDARVIVVANRVRDDTDLEAIRAVLGEHELVAVPEDDAIRRADEEGVAPIDAAPEAPGVCALADLAARVATSGPV